MRLCCIVFELASYLSKVAIINFPHLHLALPLRLGDSVRVSRKSLPVVWYCLHDFLFSRFDTIPACVGRRDGQTDKRKDGRTHEDS